MKNNLIYIIGSIFIVLVLIILLVGIYQFKWFDNFFDKNNNYKIINENLKKLIEKVVAEAEKNDNNVPIEQKEVKIAPEIKKLEKKAEEKTTSKENIQKKGVTGSKDEKKVISYAKGSSLPNQSFDSLGEYISTEEYNYRTRLINSLTIKTIVINKLTIGNGISQEFYKVVYKEKMIPAKVLDEIVESKEFRNIIPDKYLKTEIKTKGLLKNESVIFPNDKIKDLLILWSLGRLSPFQKAWLVKAEN